jgi:hypothetical protein
MINGVIAALIPWDLLAWLAGGLAALVAVWVAGKRNGAVRAENKGLRNEVATHERINDADLGLGASDDERIKRLREFATKHGD